MKKIVLLSALGLIGNAFTMEMKQCDTNIIDAVLSQKADLVLNLLEQGTDPNTVFPHKKFGHWTLVEAAVSGGNCFILKNIIERGGNLETRNFQGQTPLLHAIFRNKTEIAQMLIEYGADVNAKSSRKKTTALEYAFRNGNYYVINLLIGHGADLNALPIEIKQKIQNNIERSEPRYTPLVQAILDEDIVLVKDLLAQGVDPNELTQRTEQYASLAPIKAAVIMGNCELIKTLIEANADLEIKNVVGDTLLLDAIRCDKKEIAQLLIEEGANVNAINEQNQKTALDYAYENKKNALMRLLKSRGANFNYYLNK